MFDSLTLARSREIPPRRRRRSRSKFPLLSGKTRSASAMLLRISTNAADGTRSQRHRDMLALAFRTKADRSRNKRLPTSTPTQGAPVLQTAANRNPDCYIRNYGALLASSASDLGFSGLRMGSMSLQASIKYLGRHLERSDATTGNS